MKALSCADKRLHLSAGDDQPQLAGLGDPRRIRPRRGSKAVRVGMIPADQRLPVCTALAVRGEQRCRVDLKLCHPVSRHVACCDQLPDGQLPVISGADDQPAALLGGMGRRFSHQPIHVGP